MKRKWRRQSGSLRKGELDEEQQRAAGDGARISSSVEELINVRDRRRQVR